MLVKKLIKQSRAFSLSLLSQRSYCTMWVGHHKRAYGEKPTMLVAVDYHSTTESQDSAQSTIFLAGTRFLRSTKSEGNQPALPRHSPSDQPLEATWRVQGNGKKGRTQLRVLARNMCKKMALLRGARQCAESCCACKENLKCLGCIFMQMLVLHRTASPTFLPHKGRAKRNSSRRASTPTCLTTT